MPFEKGHEKIPGSGRQKGQISQEKRDIKAVTQAIVNYIGDDETLQSVLDDLRVNNPSALLTFLGKVVPKDINLSSTDGSMTPIVIVKLPKKEIT